MSDADFNKAIDAELAEFFDSIAAEDAALAAKDARIAELEEALRPFADNAVGADNLPDAMTVGLGLCTAGDFRRARAVLEKGTTT